MDVSQYLDVFIDETNEHIQSLSDNIMTLESEPENHDVINEIFRAAHSLKGMAGTMGFKRMQHLTHDMENVFQEVRSDKIKVNGEMIDVLFQCLDAIEGYLNTVKETSSEGTNDNEAIIAALNAILNGTSVPAAAPKPAEEASEAPAAAGDSKKKFLEYEYTDNELSEVKSAEESGQKVYGFTAYVQKECLLKAARAFLVFKAVEEFGQILIYRPSSQDIEDEKFEQDFTFLLASESDLTPILEAATAVSEIDEVLVKK